MVARLLAQRFGKGVHLEGDVFRRSIVSGRHEMTPTPSPEALRQLELRYRVENNVVSSAMGKLEALEQFFSALSWVPMLAGLRPPY